MCAKRLRSNLAPPLAGRGRREAPGEGLSPRIRLQASLRKQPLTPTLSPQERGEGEEPHQGYEPNDFRNNTGYLNASSPPRAA
jgi:hypothetical protein